MNARRHASLLAVAAAPALPSVTRGDVRVWSLHAPDSALGIGEADEGSVWDWLATTPGVAATLRSASFASAGSRRARAAAAGSRSASSSSACV